MEYGIQSFLLLFIAVGCCMGYEMNVEAIPCNSTSDCEPYTNRCQITDCQNGFCEFAEDIFEDGCCTNPSDCIEKDCEIAICSENICGYEEKECTSYNMGDVIGAIVGFSVLLVLLSSFCLVVFLIICQRIYKCYKSMYSSSTEGNLGDENNYETTYPLPKGKTLEVN